MTTHPTGGTGETLIFTCAGAAHTGQVANRVGVQLRQDMSGTLFCAAAVAAGIPDKLERTRDAGRRIAIDGCEDDCCRRIIEQAEMPVDLHVRITDLGIEKQPAEPSLITDTKKVVDRVHSQLDS
jgi:uncharacterized metal-binding protein